MKKLILIVLISLTACTNLNRTHEQTPSEKSSRENIYNFYKEWYGVPYKYGGAAKDGVDCSGFAKNLYSKVYNIELPRNTTLQMNVGHQVDYFEKRSGDLIFFKTGADTYHVGIYYENDNFIHASTSRGVTISNMNEDYWFNNFIGIRRVRNE